LCERFAICVSFRARGALDRAARCDSAEMPAAATIAKNSRGAMVDNDVAYLTSVRWLLVASTPNDDAAPDSA
jgi:hypothetical protein